jgi:hypothetical protein
MGIGYLDKLLNFLYFNNLFLGLNQYSLIVRDTL